MIYDCKIGKGGIKMIAKVFSTKDYLKSDWSGGTTTQMYIYPENADYRRQNFILRLSSATVAQDISEFTKLPNIDRIIMSLDNPMELEHNGNQKVKLEPFEAYAFSGDDETVGCGKCTDFNVMLQRDEYKEAELFINEAGEFDLFSSEGDCFMYVYEGAYKIITADEGYILNKGDLLHFEDYSFSKIKRTDVNSKMVILKIEW